MSDDDGDLTSCNYLITIYEANKALEQSIEMHSYKPLVSGMNLEAFLNSTEKATKTFKKEDIRGHLGRLVGGG